MRFNFKEGMRRFGIVVSVLGGAAGAIRGYFMAADAFALSAGGFRQESVLTNYAIASLLPVLGFWLPWEITRFLDWISSMLSKQPTTHGSRRRQLVPHKRPGIAQEVGTSYEAKRPASKLRSRSQTAGE
jgi:hypothetical protein